MDSRAVTEVSKMRLVSPRAAAGPGGGGRLECQAEGAVRGAECLGMVSLFFVSQ